jgi:hypothetical protein
MPFITNLHTAQQIPNRFAEPVGTALAHDGASPFLVTSGQVSRDVNFLGSLGVAVILDISGHAPCDFAAK